MPTLYIPTHFFINELASRFSRDAFLVLSLVIPVVAGLGLNFGIVIGAIAGQIAVIIACYYRFGGVSGLLLMCFIIALPIASLLGYYESEHSSGCYSIVVIPYIYMLP